MITKTKHSPLPWVVNIDDEFNIRSNADGYSLATFSGWRLARENAANAVYVVHCVNAHDALVEALEAAAAFVPQTIGTGGEARPTDVAIKIRTALALARP